MLHRVFDYYLALYCSCSHVVRCIIVCSGVTALSGVTHEYPPHRSSFRRFFETPHPTPLKRGVNLCDVGDHCHSEE